jgi:hypothetical protein
LRDKPTQNCREVNVVLDEHIQHVAVRIAELRALQRQLRDLQQTCAKEPDGCGILKELARDTHAARTPAGSRHIRGSHMQRAAR